MAFKEIKEILRSQHFDTQRIVVNNKLKKAEEELKMNIAQLELIEKTADRANLEIKKAEKYLGTQNVRLRELLRKSAELEQIYYEQITVTAGKVDDIEDIRKKTCGLKNLEENEKLANEI